MTPRLGLAAHFGIGPLSREKAECPESRHLTAEPRVEPALHGMAQGLAVGYLWSGEIEID